MNASVIICTYNRAESLRTALQCLEWQTFDDFEVIIVNGPSTDHTSDVLEEYAGKIRVENCTEKNLPMSRNIGLQASAGDIVCYIDDDSEPDTTWLSNVMQEFCDPSVGAVTGPTFDSTGVFAEYSNWLYFENAPRVVNRIFPYHNGSESQSFPVTHGCNMSIRRSALEKIGGFLEEFVFYHEEPELCARLHENKYAIICCESCFMIHRTENVNNDKNIRTKEKGLLDPYHYLKNHVYLLHYVNRNARIGSEVLQKQVNLIVESLKQDACFRFKNGLISREEWQYFLSKIDQALNWGIENGESLTFTHPKVAAAKCESFLKFKKKRSSTSLTICLLLWSLSDVDSGNVRDYTTLAKYLARRGHEVHIIGPKSDAAFKIFKDAVHYHGVDPACSEVNIFAPTIRPHVQYQYAFYKKVQDIKKLRCVDIVMGYIFSYTPLFCMLDKNLQTVLTLCTTHKTWCGSHPHWKCDTSDIFMAFEAMALRKAENVHSLSNFITRGVQEDYPESLKNEAHVFVVPIGVEGPALVPSRLPDGKIRILFTGRLEGRKGADILLAAIVKVFAKYSNVELYLAGNDNLASPTGRTYRQNFEAQYFGTEIFTKVHFLGFVSDEELCNQYAQCDIYCSPSISESFGIIFIEAMSYGKPVIGCRAGGMPEVIAEGETGLLAEPGDVNSLVQCIETLVCDENLRTRMGLAARRRYEEHYTAEKYAESMEREFYRIVGKERVIANAGDSI